MSAATEQLRTHQEQLDADGIMVGVSRQAIDETLAEYERMKSALLICQDYLDLSLGSPAYEGPSPYAAIQSALGTGHEQQAQD